MAPTGGPWFSTKENYAETYNLEQLRALIAKSCTAIPAGSIDKGTCIALLIGLDKKEGKWTGPFQFLELAGEIRNYIYEELLTIKPPNGGGTNRKRGCHPTILQTSKDVCREGTGILYGVNTRELFIKCSNEQILAQKTPTQLGENVFHASSFPERRIHYFNRELEPHFPRFENLSVSLEIKLGPPNRPITTTAGELCKTASQCLYHLVAKLVDSPKLKHFALKVHFTSVSGRTAFRVPGNDLLQQALWPITLLGDSRNVAITGVSSVVREYIETNATAPLRPFPGPHLVTASQSLLKDIYTRMRVFDHPGQAAAWRLTSGSGNSWSMTGSG